MFWIIKLLFSFLNYLTGSVLASHFLLFIVISCFVKQNFASKSVYIIHVLDHKATCFSLLNYMTASVLASHFPLFIVISCFVKQNLAPATCSVIIPRSRNCCYNAPTNAIYRQYLRYWYCLPSIVNFEMFCRENAEPKK